MRVDTGRLRVVPPDVDPSDPEIADDGLPSPGQYIREHRTRQGRSIEELSVDTRIPRRSLDLLEEDRFAELPGPVFVKGFLRCCARSLGLEPDKVLELLCEREREISRARRREQRSITGAHAAPSKRAEASASRTGPVSGRPIQRFLSSVTATNILLWIVVVLFLAVLVMAAFNLSTEPVAGTGG